MSKNNSIIKDYKKKFSSSKSTGSVVTPLPPSTHTQDGDPSPEFSAGRPDVHTPIRTSAADVSAFVQQKCSWEGECGGGTGGGGGGG